MQTLKNLLTNFFNSLLHNWAVLLVGSVLVWILATGFGAAYVYMDQIIDRQGYLLHNQTVIYNNMCNKVEVKDNKGVLKENWRIK